MSAPGTTPGPWQVANGCPQYICNGDKWIASTMGVKGDEGEANAALMAAAPDLYEALQAIAIGEIPGDPNEPHSMLMVARKMALAALAKASPSARSSDGVVKIEGV